MAGIEQTSSVPETYASEPLVEPRAAKWDRVDSDNVLIDEGHDATASMQSPEFNSVRPILSEPTLDFNDLYGSDYDAVMSELQQMAAQVGADPYVMSYVNGLSERLGKRLADTGESFNPEALLIAMLSMMDELRDALKQLAAADLEHQNDAIEHQHNKKLSQIIESLEAKIEAEKAAETNKIFGWLALGATAFFLLSTMVVARADPTSVALTGVSFLMSLGLQADSMSGGKAVGFISSWFVSEDEAKSKERAEQIITYVLMAFAVTTGAAGLFKGVRAAGGLSIATEGPRNFMKHPMESIKEALGFSTRGRQLDINVQDSKLRKIVDELYKYSFYMQVGSNMGREVTNIVVAKKEKEVSLAEVDLKLIEAQLKMLNEIMSQIMDLIETLYESEVSTAQFVSDMVKMLKDAKTHTGRAMA